MDLLILVGIAVTIYFVFLLWYRGLARPLTSEEIEHFINRMKQMSDLESEPENKALKVFREITANDDGKAFLMVNLMKFKDNDPNSEAMKAHKRYSKNVVPQLIRRGSHPIFSSNVQGRFLYEDDSVDWDQVAIVRYRSRRDFLKFASALADKDAGKDKWISMEKTHVFPTKGIIQLGSIQLIFALILIIIILAIFMM